MFELEVFLVMLLRLPNSQGSPAMETTSLAIERKKHGTFQVN